MNKYEFTNPKTGRTYKRVSKKQARKLFNDGKEFIIVPCKCRLFGCWGLECYIKEEYAFTKPFDVLINEYIYYNCNYELGYYPAFYVISL